MKHIMILLLVMALVLCGCAKEKLPADSNVQNSADAPENNTMNESDWESMDPEYTQQAMVSVSLPVVNETTVADDGTTLCNYTYQNIYLVVQDQQIADTVIVDFLNRQDSHHTAAKTISDQALAEYANQENWMPYNYEYLYSPTRIDYNVLSMYGENVVQYGSSNPQVECSAANYNMISGDVLTLGSILYHIDAQDKLCDLVLENLDVIAADKQLYDEYPDIVRQRFSRDESYDEDWYFTNTGLCFFFTPYEIAPYVSGVVTVEVSYSDLSGIIADEFFPLEEDIAKGVIQVELLNEMDLGAYTQIAELPLNEEGEHIFLHCDGLVRDVKIDIGTWNESGTEYTPTCTVFATYALTPGDGIMIQAAIPDTAPNLRLTYHDGNQIISTFISQSGKDGSILLLDNI